MTLLDDYRPLLGFGDTREKMDSELERIRREAAAKPEASPSCSSEQPADEEGPESLASDIYLRPIDILRKIHDIIYHLDTENLQIRLIHQQTSHQLHTGPVGKLVVKSEFGQGTIFRIHATINAHGELELHPVSFDVSENTAKHNPTGFIHYKGVTYHFHPERKIASPLILRMSGSPFAILSPENFADITTFVRQTLKPFIDGSRDALKLSKAVIRQSKRQRFIRTLQELSRGTVTEQQSQQKARISFMPSPRPKDLQL